MVNVRKSRFFAMLPQFRPSRETLAHLSNDTSLVQPPFDTGLTSRVAEAWLTPFYELSCAQVLLLTSQRFGLAWLAEPVALFAARFPSLEIEFYPGDLTIAALRVFPDLLRIAPEAARSLAIADLSWMSRAYDFDVKLANDAQNLVAAAGVLAGS